MDQSDCSFTYNYDLNDIRSMSDMILETSLLIIQGFDMVLYV